MCFLGKYDVDGLPRVTWPHSVTGTITCTGGKLFSMELAVTYIYNGFGAGLRVNVGFVARTDHKAGLCIN
jgi:hypothetical protein